MKAWGGLGQGKVKVTVNGLDLPGENLPPFSREWTLGVRPAYPALLKHYRAVLKDRTLELAGRRAWSSSIPPGAKRLLSLSSRPPLNLGAADLGAQGLPLWLPGANRQRPVPVAVC